MARMSSRFAKLLSGLLLLFVFGLPLRAQLDPKLQGTTTDFMDLFQQSSTAKVKPEILTIFDFSGSMSSLMFHPLYQNVDSADSDAYRYMSFTLGSGSGGYGTYVITATSRQDASALATITVTIGSSIASATYSQTQGASTFSSGGRTYTLYTTVSNVSIAPSTGNLTSGTSYTFSATVEFTAVRRGINYALSTYPGTLNSGLTWSVSGPNSSTLTPTTTSGGTVTTSSTDWTSSAQNTVWVAPAASGYSTPVTATLDCSQPGSGAVSGASYVGALTSNLLIKPDGSVVTATDAAAASSTSGLAWAGNGAADVRNWVCAASHVRFSVTVGSDTRTVDVPIPWKVTSRDSSGNPLSSVTVLDQVVKNGTTYGSGLGIEIDKCYAVNGGQYIFSGGTGTATSTTLGNGNIIAYRPAYISWLFNGKYADGPYAGKYVVYDAANASLAGGQGNVNWGQGYGPSSGLWNQSIQVPQYSIATRAYTGSINRDASLNVVPALTRCQAVKNAAIRTWIPYQSDVLWAYRFLDTTNETPYTGYTINQSSSTSITTTNPATNRVYGGDSGWKLLNNTSAQGITSTNGNSVSNMTRLAQLFPNNGTPLTSAMARGLAQFTDPNSVFNTVETGTNAPSQCMSHFLILFTDGIDNNNSGTNNQCTSTPYINGNAISAQAGNRAVLSNTSLINYSTSSSAYWNIFTFAGVAAHMADSSLGTAGTDYMLAPRTGAGLENYSTSSVTPNTFLPYSIPSRNSVSFQHDHRITTMTVGVSLGGNYNDATSVTSPKRNLFWTAAVGDAHMTSWSDISTLVPFVYDPQANGGLGGKAAGSLYFFDAVDPSSLVQNLQYAIISAIGESRINVASNPNLPYIGTSLGKQIYLTTFVPPPSGGVLWSGDLLMFPTRVDSTGKTVILDKNGNIPTALNYQTAGWSASSAMLNNRLWSSRKLFTRIPNATSLSSFTYTGTAYTDATVGLKNYVATTNAATFPAGSTAQQNLIKLVMGQSQDPQYMNSTTPSQGNRSNIMGDVIDSTPGYLEYSWSDVSSRISSPLSSSRTRFRLILVGTNQGYLHAFGETTSTSSDLVSGEVDELWAFYPTDFLANMGYLSVASNSHRFMVDGAPTIYFLDLPPTGGGTGNGTYDSSNVTINPLTDTTHERAIAIVGLGKGGRSYYALNLHDPFNPTLQWALVPDEAASIPSSRNKTGLSLTTLQTLVANMGYSTGTPSIGRITYGGVYKDVVFLGGGYSVPEIEANFTGTPKLGRSVLALDVYTGDILAAVDLTSSSIGGTTIGPIAKGLVPFEFILGSGMAQRAYFTDLWGGLWCWGSKQVVNNTSSVYNRFRMDTSELQKWSSDGSASTPYGNTGIRKVYQDPNSSVSATTHDLTGPAYTTLPSPFLVGTFPGAGYKDAGNVTTAVPAAVGIALESGNRYDPLDFGTNKPANTRLTVVFDRQDSRAWGFDTATGPDTGINSDSKLLNAGKWNDNAVNSSTIAYGAASITQGTSTYYLAPSTQANTLFGYYVVFPDRVQDTSNSSVYHYSKGINSPLVVAKSLYYSYFTPTTADVCTGGSGYTYTYRICDVMNPVVYDSRSGISCAGGNLDKWVNVASDFTILGVPGVQQAGSRVDPSDPNKTVMDTSAYLGLSQARVPQARVWRTIR